MRASASLILLLGARRSSAQSTTTLLPDATVLPSRAVRVRALSAWTRFDELLGDGSKRNIGSALATDSLGSAQIPLFAASETDIRTASGLANFRLTAGQLVAVANSRVLTAPVILEYGLTPRLTIGIVVPLVETRTTLGVQLNPALGLANVGPNPAYGSAGDGVRSQNAALITSLRQAADTLRSRVTTCQAAPTAPICTPMNGQQSAVQALLLNTTNFAGALERLYGTSTSIPGQPYVPIAKDASQEVINSRIAALKTAYETFLAKSVVSGSVAPAAAPAANAQLQSLLTAVGHDTLRSIDRSSIGDISLGATYQIANTFDDTSTARRHYRLAVNGTLRVGTGQPGNRNRFFDFGTGYGQHGLEGGIAADAQLNRRLSASAIGSYTLQLGTVDVARVPSAGNLAYPLGGAIGGTFSAGNVLALSVIPRLRLSGYFALNGRYSILRTGADQYTLGPVPPTDSLTATAVAPTAPYGVASATAQQIGIGFSYSTVLGPDANPGRIPFEVSFSHLETIAASGGPVAKSFREQIELRVYFRR